ncbi:hypothetical protein QE412_002830 [Microbacterium trichothecenolyticum]|uniref:Uncharacterized protein n=1 Tax=Microbacterium trichothecenolyticum TaxID=69370 RepID=A0ABU0TX71_MICTR|nr:hypothetical protein [Microbacterium trichothecenolyticum]
MHGVTGVGPADLLLPPTHTVVVTGAPDADAPVAPPR